MRLSQLQVLKKVLWVDPKGFCDFKDGGDIVVLLAVFDALPVLTGLYEHVVAGDVIN